MKRLTENAYGQMRTPPPARNKSKNPSYESLYKRLAAIEDILGDEYDRDELREIIQAKREGRCIVLPCKKGDTVRRIVHDATPHVTKDRCTDIKYEIWLM